jgi:hypothetical protein
MEELIVTIKDGDIQVEVEGVKGPRCLELTQAIESLLGEKISRQLKDGFYSQVNLKPTIVLKNTSRTSFEEI